MAKKKSKKESNPTYEFTLKNVVLSYPVLVKPKPFKGKSYYSLDALVKKNSKQIPALQELIDQARIDAYGDDESEWPTDKHGNLDIKEFILDGDENEDAQGYAGKYYIKTSTQSAVPVVDMDAKSISPSLIKAGMVGNIAVNIRAWENDGDTGVSIYLAGVQIDPEQEFKAFGGGKTGQQLFGKKKDADDEDESEDDEDEEDEVGEDEEDEDEEPVRKSKKKPLKKKRKPIHIDDEDEEDEDDE